MNDPPASADPAPPAQKAGELYTIVHLSDLHFGGAFDSDLWEYVKAFVRELKPSLIIVSGDLVETPSALLLLQARCELRKLEADSSSKLFVIPGNHDVGVKGNFSAPYLSRLFWRVFKNDTASSEHSIGPAPWLVNRQLRPDRKWFKRTRGLFGWMRGQWRAARLVRKYASEYPSPAEMQTPLSDGTVFVVPFDSNAKIRLATGYVARGEIYAQSSDLEQRQQRRDASFTYALRIAVVHHHPVPIPFAIVNEGTLSFEPFLVFRNAGEFLKALSDRSFDLVLHGHHHYYNFTRLGFGPEGDGSEMGILAAGSATVRYNEAGRNSFNVLTISPNGRVEITPHFLGGGKVAGSKPPSGFALHTTEGLKQRNNRRAVEFQELERDEVSLELAVDEFGTQRMAYSVRGLRVTGGYSTDHRSFEVAVVYGRPVKSTFALDAESVQQGFGTESITPERGNEIKRRITFGRNLTSRTQAANYTFSWRIQNTIMLTRWEADQLGRTAKQSLYFDVTIPARRLRLKLQLPEELQGLRPYVECMIPSNYPNLPLDNEREAEAVEPRTVDPEMSEFESGHLRSEAEGVWTLEVNYPLVGYKYSISWNVADRAGQGTSPFRAGQVQMYRDLLLRYGEPRRKGGAPNAVTEILQKFFEDLCGRYGTADPKEEMTLTLMVYDEKEKKLRLVDGVWMGTRKFDWDFTLPLGDGVGGAAFKQRRPLLFAIDVMGSSGRDAYLGPDEGGDRFPYEVLLSSPVFHPLERDAAVKRRGVLPDDTIGVVSFGSTSPGSGLLNLSQQQDDQSAQFRKFWGVSQLVFEAILDTVLRELGSSERILTEENQSE